MKLSLALLGLSFAVAASNVGCNQNTCECVNNCTGQTVRVSWPADRSCANGACDGISNNGACRDVGAPAQDATSDNPNPSGADTLHSSDGL